MTKLNIIIGIAVLAAVACIRVEAINLRQHEPSRILDVTEFSDNGAGDLFSTEKSTSEDNVVHFLVKDGTPSSITKSVKEIGFGLLLVPSSVDGSSALDSLDTSEGSDDTDVTDSNDSKSGSEDTDYSTYQPGTVKPAPVDGSGVLDKPSLSWQK
ncbi:hypothetical protein PHMEG_0005956 [Phytophthora megakarya]|uniref:RxLR effector protein n=1 Tax=Phytophthora megakarya TaxID=4795 RepID=A0A225WPX5_9STRA|nr:hypothetical protein PHMEG_0005956 [Phytophthora megakarya]